MQFYLKWHRLILFLVQSVLEHKCLMIIFALGWEKNNTINKNVYIKCSVHDPLFISTMQYWVCGIDCSTCQTSGSHYYIFIHAGYCFSRGLARQSCRERIHMSYWFGLSVYKTKILTLTIIGDVLEECHIPCMHIYIPFSRFR